MTGYNRTKSKAQWLLALELGRTSDVPLPSVALSNELLTSARAMGPAKEDFAVIFDGQKYHVKAGDYVWTSVGGTHGFFNKGTVPMRWIETQTPQPPDQQAFRFPADWAYLTTKLDI